MVWLMSTHEGIGVYLPTVMNDVILRIIPAPVQRCKSILKSEFALVFSSPSILNYKTF
jgi:hypothetical protein